MNRFLADCVGFINATVAVLIIAFWSAVGGIAGYGFNIQRVGVLRAEVDGNVLLGLMLGGLLGLILAILFCGVLAIFLSMHNELKAIRRGMNGTSTPILNRSAPQPPVTAPVWAK